MEEFAHSRNLIRTAEALGEIWGEKRALRETILRLGRRKFGAPSPEQEKYLKGIED